MMRLKSHKQKAIPITLVLLLLFSVNASAVSKLDASMCILSQTDLESAVTQCTIQCQNEWNANQKANYLVYKQSANVDCDAQWQTCAQACPNGQETNEGIDYGPKITCETDCTDAMHTCENSAGEAVKMYTIIESRLTRCQCENCLIPYCRYFEDKDCANTIKTCDGINQLVTGSRYSSSKKSYIGCNTSAGVAATLTTIAVGSGKGKGDTGDNSGSTGTGGPTGTTGSGSNAGQTTNAGQTNTQTQQATKKTEKKKSVVKQGLDVDGLKKSQKAQKVEQKVEQIKQKIGADKKDYVIKKPDSGDKYKLDSKFKLKYHLNKVSDNYIDKIIENVPVLKYFGTLIKSKKDDYVYQKTEEKTKKNMIDYHTDYYGGKAMNHYDDETEKKLSPAKSFFESVAEKTTAPFAWTLNKLGSFFKSETAKSGSKLYKDFEAQVKDNMKSGMDRKTAIDVTKRDFKETDIYSRKYGIFSRASKDKNVGAIIDSVADDLIKDGKI